MDVAAALSKAPRPAMAASQDFIQSLILLAEVVQLAILTVTPTWENVYRVQRERTSRRRIVHHAAIVAVGGMERRPEPLQRATAKTVRKESTVIETRLTESITAWTALGEHGVRKKQQFQNPNVKHANPDVTTTRKVKYLYLHARLAKLEGPMTRLVRHKAPVFPVYVENSSQ